MTDKAVKNGFIAKALFVGLVGVRVFSPSNRNCDLEASDAKAQLDAFAFKSCYRPFRAKH